MKYFVRFLSLCLGVLLFHSCLQEENDLSPTPTGISQSPAVLKARAAFEDYASQDIDYQKRTTPDVFRPNGRKQSYSRNLKKPL